MKLEPEAKAEQPHVARAEFQNFREDLNQKFQDINKAFEKTHSCNRRIEDKIDDLAKGISPIMIEFRQRQQTVEAKSRKIWDMKLALFGTGIGICSSLVTATVMTILNFGN